MARISLLFLVIASAATLAAFPAAVATAVGPEQGTVVKVELDLKASNGLHAQLENSEDDETVTLELRRKGQIVKYEARAKPPKRG